KIRNTRKGETTKDRASLLFPFVYFVYFVVLPRVTTKDSKYTERRNHQRQGFLASSLSCTSCTSWFFQGLTTTYSKYTKKQNHQRQGFLALPFRVICVFRGSSKGQH